MTGMNITYTLDGIAYALAEIVSAHDSLIGAKDEIESGTQMGVMNALQNVLKSLNLAKRSVRALLKMQEK